MEVGHWSEVDDFIAAHLLGDDETLAAALHHNEASGLPPIDVSPVQGKLLQLMARLAGARRILEVGTLGGYSTIWLARALPEDGRLLSLELDPHHAAVARQNIDRAGVGHKVEIRVGPANESLAALTEPAMFDFVFIDADKPSNASYVEHAVRLGRPGATIIVDNVVRQGDVLDAASDDDRVIGTRLLFETLRHHPKLDATAVQTVGSKGWDGFVVARILDGGA